MIPGDPPRKSKHRGQKTFCSHGHKHDSKREAKRCDELHLLERAGEITHLEVHPKYYFHVNGRQVKHETGQRVVYTADFAYFTQQASVVEDVKGRSKKADNESWPLRKAFFRACFPDVELREVRG